MKGDGGRSSCFFLFLPHMVIRGFTMSLFVYLLTWDRYKEGEKGVCWIDLRWYAIWSWYFLNVILCMYGYRGF